MKKINVTKTFLPPLEEYQAYLTKIWDSGQITNQGPLLLEFEQRVKQYLNATNLHFVANGTLALQLALRALDITEGEIITTPFSYVASTSAILWEHCHPAFVDIKPDTLCIDPDKIEAAITAKTKAILAVHVFGLPCEVAKIEVLAKKHNLKVIYDGAHAFGVEHNDQPLLNYGDISTCSFHATKLFHTIEGGCVITKNNAVSKRVELMKRFGHTWDEHFMLGINAKASELQAAMGLCNLGYVKQNIEKRRQITQLYDKLLGETFTRPIIPDNTLYNYCYYPILVQTEGLLLELIDKLKQENIFPRRYFYPSLNTLPYLKERQSCPIAEDIASRIMCLPLYEDLDKAVVEKICRIITS